MMAARNYGDWEWKPARHRHLTCLQGTYCLVTGDHPRGHPIQMLSDLTPLGLLFFTYYHIPPIARVPFQPLFAMNTCILGNLAHNLCFLMGNIRDARISLSDKSDKISFLLSPLAA